MTAPVISLRDPEFEKDRFGMIEKLRAQHGHARTPDGAAVFFSQADVAEVLSCRRFRFHFNQIDADKSPYLAKAIEGELLNMHEPAHGRLSRLVKLALRDRVFEGMRSHIDAISDQLIRDLPAGPFDFCAKFADPLPAQVLGPMFGIPYQDVDGLNDWIRVGGRKVDALQSGVGLDAVEEANRNIHTYLRKVLSDRRTNLGDDLLSELMKAELNGDRMNDDELIFLCAELASAGVDTTRAQLPLILLALMEHRGEWDKLCADPSLALRAVDEGMRYYPLPWAIPHAATEDHTMNGIDFKTGDVAFVLVPAANRDPAVVPNPGAFDITRDRVKNFAFGAGMHACPGAQLARMEMSIALAKLAEARPDMTVQDIAWEKGATGRTLRSLTLA